MHQQGFSVEEIAANRELTTNTVLSHFAYLYEKGESIKIQKFVQKEEIQRIAEIIKTLEEPYRLKEIFDALSEEVSYGKIRLALLYLKNSKY